MDYTGIQSKRITKTIDLQLVGIYTDKKTSHIDKMLSKPAFNLVKKCFKNNNFTGELGDTRTFDDQEHEFYDLQEDPHELVNLAMDRNRRAEIREWYQRLREAEIEEFVSLQAKA